MPDYVGPPIGDPTYTPPDDLGPVCPTAITSGVAATIPDQPNMDNAAVQGWGQEGPPPIPSDSPYGVVRMRATIDIVCYHDPDRAVVHFKCLMGFYSAVRCTHERAKMMENLAALGLHVEYDRDLRMLLFGFPA
jgi:hypothetical protein